MKDVTLVKEASNVVHKNNLLTNHVPQMIWFIRCLSNRHFSLLDSLTDKYIFGSPFVMIGKQTELHEAFYKKQ
jgi:hypothetical protein